MIGALVVIFNVNIAMEVKVERIVSSIVDGR